MVPALFSDKGEKCIMLRALFPFQLRKQVIPQGTSSLVFCNSPEITVTTTVGQKTLGRSKLQTQLSS
jgi:hypothetical protein